ncbi:hypothetical protein I7I50_09906 [Histoplasma capsulatum G186AR]|uniref:Uncharacterized protein n=1 Tax=Ajellomyces capsulatus TaxID=5037 RepID=A0A8H8D616_AJECA|nr:hypothetical protein I7I52_01144 [Histoplasma capsulatum]QSS68813.1 hypothetical protein I7I50_09906 [Histoplasma capsulatum G186AR]
MLSLPAHRAAWPHSLSRISPLQPARTPAIYPVYVRDDLRRGLRLVKVRYVVCTDFVQILASGSSRYIPSALASGMPFLIHIL